MSSNNNKLSLVIEESQKDSGEVIQLFPTLRQTIQPKVLLRLGVFVPTLKSTDKGGRKNHRIDATEPLSRLSIVEGEGYSQIQIYGPRLDMDSDFKSWCKTGGELRDTMAMCGAFAVKEITEEMLW